MALGLFSCYNEERGAGMIQEGRYFGFKERELYYRYALPAEPKASILIIHGYGEHSGRYVHVIEAFAARGYAVFVPDYRGHGRSSRTLGDLEGRNKIREDLHILTQTISQQCPGLPVVLLGHSMGGMFALYQLLKYQDQYVAAVLSAPAILLPEGISPLIKAMAGVLAGIVPKLPVQELDLSEATRNMEMRAEDEKDPLQYKGKARARTGNETILAQQEIQDRLNEISLPLLIMHGDDDKVIDPAATEIVYSRASSQDKTKKLWPGLYHELMNEPEREKVFEFIFTWLSSRLPD